jgi:hypothetical protein
MKNTPLLLTVLLSILLIACGKHPVIVDAAIDISFKNSSGNDLLSSGTQKHFSPDSIHLYTVVNGVKKEVNYYNLDYPHNFFVYKNDSLNTFYLRVFVETDETLLELNPGITDTIRCLIDRSNGIQIRKVWYNSLLKWENNAKTRVFTVMK